MNYWPSSVNDPELEKERSEIRKSKALEPLARLEGFRVLVVDDDNDTREMFYAVLLQCKSEVAVAASTSEALLEIERRRPEVLVSDNVMPETLRFTCFAKLRDNRIAFSWGRINRNKVIIVKVNAECPDL